MNRANCSVKVAWRSEASLFLPVSRPVRVASSLPPVNFFDVSHVLFDLDNCLVIAPHVTKTVPSRVAEYAVRYLQIPQESASRQCSALYERHGTNLEGFLVEGYDVNPDHYHEYVHGGLDYEALGPTPGVKQVLDSWKVKKYVYTNADFRHVERVLDKTALSGCFDDIVCFESQMKLYDGSDGPTPCKPKNVSIKLALKQIGCDDPLQAMLFDDAPRNIHMGMDAGVRSVLVGDIGCHGCEYFFHVKDLTEIPVKLPHFYL